MRLMMIMMCTVALGGCFSTSGPSFMPAGYTYHQEPYKAPPGAKAQAPSSSAEKGAEHTPESIHGYNN